jgi:hypothetical protein
LVRVPGNRINVAATTAMPVKVVILITTARILSMRFLQ